jgi:hypothetical protein
MAAMNGVPLFGWSTAVIFQVLWTTISGEDLRNSIRASVPISPHTAIDWDNDSDRSHIDGCCCPPV